MDKEAPSTVVRQVAVWAVTDNPSRWELDQVYRISMGGPAADDSDIDAAAELLTKAGINPKSKRLFSSHTPRAPRSSSRSDEARRLLEESAMTPKELERLLKEGL